MPMGLMDGIFRRLPLFRGKERLARILFNERIESQKDLLIRGRFACAYWVPNISENVSLEIFINGIYEQATSDYILKNLPPNGIFLDLGANIGAITIPVSKKRKDVKIICVEAAPWIYQYLTKNLNLNRAENVKAINNALYYNDDQKLDFYSPAQKFGKGSLSPVFTNEGVSVTTIKVDTILKKLGIQKVDIIKIDVEGYESQVFKGATELLRRPDAPDIIFEFVDWAEKAAAESVAGSSQQILRDLGYRIYYFTGSEKMKEVNGILKKGFHMLFATKTNIAR